MKIIFNDLGAVINRITDDEPLRQGNIANTITATFQGKDNLDYVATLNFTRPDKKVVSDLFMKPSAAKTDFTLKFDNPFFFALSGQTTITIFLRDAKMKVVASGQVSFTIEKTDFNEDVPCIDQDQYNDLLAQLAEKMPIVNNTITLAVGEELPEKGERNTMYLVPRNDGTDIYDRYWWNDSKGVYQEMGSTETDLVSYIRQTEKGQPNGVAPLDQYGKVPAKHLVGQARERIYGKYNSPTSFTDNATGQEAVKGDQYLYVDVQAKPYQEYEWVIDEFIQVGDKAQFARDVIFDNEGTDLNSHDLQNVVEEINTKKVNVAPLVWTTLPEGAVDKKTFYNKTIATLRTATNKIYMFGTPEETPIKEFFEIWGKPTDFKATHVYITIASISNTAGRDSFVMIIHSSNYSNMYFYIVNGYSSQLVGNGSGWISANLLNAEKQKQLAKIDGYYQSMRVGNADISDVATALVGEEISYPNQEFITRETANGEALTITGEKGVSKAILTELKGNTIVANQLIRNSNFATGIEKWNADNGTLTYENGKLVFTANETTSAYKYRLYNPLSVGSIKIKNGHTYLAHLKIEIDKPLVIRFTTLYNVFLQNIEIENTRVNDVIILATANKDSNDAFIFSIWNSLGTMEAGTKVKFSLIETTDLTQYFNGVNVPTSIDDPRIQEVKDYLAKHPEYNTGTLVSTTPTKLVSYGTNLFNGELEKGILNQGDGQNFEYPNGYRSVGYIKVIPNKDIASQNFVDNVSGFVICEYDINKIFIKTNVSYSKVIKAKLSNETRYIRFSCDIGKVPTEPLNAKVSVAFGTTPPTTYIPYIAPNEITIKYPSGVSELNGLKITPHEPGDHCEARDILTSKTLTQKFKTIELEKLTWKKRDNGAYFSSIIDDAYNKSNYQKSVSICNKEYNVSFTYDIVQGTGNDKIYSIGGTNVNLGILIKDASKTALTEAEFAETLKGIVVMYEIETPIETPIEPEADYDYKAYNKGIEEFEGTEVPSVADITYNVDITQALINLIKANLDTRVAELERDMAHYSADIVSLGLDKADKTSVMNKYRYRGNIYDIDLYNQLLSVDEIMNGALFSVEITNDTPIEQIRKGYPKLTQGAIVYGWLSTDELGQPMIIHTEQGIYKIIDGGTLTCEKISGLMETTINYSVVDDMKLQLDQTIVNDYCKGLEIWIDVNVDGTIVNVLKTIKFNAKSTAQIYVGGQITDDQRFNKDIVIRYLKTTGIVDVYSEGTIPPNTFKLVDVKGLI